MDESGNPLKREETLQQIPSDTSPSRPSSAKHFTISKIHSDHIHPASYEITGLKLIIRYLSKLPKTKQNVPELITSGPTLLNEAKQTLASYKIKENCAQCGNKPIFYYLTRRFSGLFHPKHAPRPESESSLNVWGGGAAQSNTSQCLSSLNTFKPRNEIAHAGSTQPSSLASKPFISNQSPFTTATSSSTLREMPNSFAQLIETTGIETSKHYNRHQTPQPAHTGQPFPTNYSQQPNISSSNFPPPPVSSLPNAMSNPALQSMANTLQSQQPPPAMYMTQFPGGLIAPGWPAPGLMQMPSGQLITTGRPLVSTSSQIPTGPPLYEMMPMGQTLLHPLRPGYSPFGLQPPPPIGALNHPDSQQINLMTSNTVAVSTTSTTDSLSLIMNNPSNQMLAPPRTHAPSIGVAWPNQSLHSSSMVGGLLVASSNATGQNLPNSSLVAAQLQPAHLQSAQLSVSPNVIQPGHHHHHLLSHTSSHPSSGSLCPPFGHGQQQQQSQPMNIAGAGTMMVSQTIPPTGSPQLQLPAHLHHHSLSSQMPPVISSPASSSNRHSSSSNFPYSAPSHLFAVASPAILPVTSSVSSPHSIQKPQSAHILQQTLASTSTTFSPSVQRIPCKQCAACMSAACGNCNTCLAQSRKLGNVRTLSAVGVGCERIKCSAPVLPLDARCALCGKDGWQQMLLGAPNTSSARMIQLGAKCSLMQCFKCGTLTHPECFRQRLPYLNHVNPLINTTLANSWQCPACVYQQHQQPHFAAAPPPSSMIIPIHSSSHLAQVVPPSPSQPSHVQSTLLTSPRTHLVGPTPSRPVSSMMANKPRPSVATVDSARLQPAVKPSSAPVTFLSSSYSKAIEVGKPTTDTKIYPEEPKRLPLDVHNFKPEDHSAAVRSIHVNKVGS